MKAARTQAHRRVTAKRIAAVCCLLVISAASLAWRLHERRPRVWRTEEVPVAFWSWRAQTPNESDVERAVRATQARALFVRAGQIDDEAGVLRRVHPVEGKFPSTLELHLVYNATRSLLSQFEQVETNELAKVIGEAYVRDVARAAEDGARVAGLQLDIDVPTRLLEKYEQLLRALRPRLPQGAKLSVTGLPTWMESAQLGAMLRAVDFWIPQCYGATIPEKSSQLVPISSPQTVAQTVARVRSLERPFYAGVSAYGYAILYSPRGNLIEVRGDLDPLRVANDSNFELVERRPFQGISSGATATTSEWRYVYRARGDGATDGLVVHEGDALMLDVPTAETLRASLRAVREEAGEKLLGLCLFRLPESGDATALTLEQIKSALADSPALIKTDVRLEVFRSSQSDESSRAGLRVRAVNTGAAGGQMGDDALTVSVRVPAGSVRGVSELEGFFSLETLCETQSAAGMSGQDAARPCSLRRANLLRLRARVWRPGASAEANISFEGQPQSSAQTLVTVLADDGRAWRREEIITIEPEVK
ncbi:MAG TPA: DUF3142 domain-containing protein [Pyrinomonadaceae bacterium]